MMVDQLIKSGLDALSQQYHDVAEEGQLSVTVLFSLSIHSGMSSGPKGSLELGGCAFLGKRRSGRGTRTY